MLLPLLDYSALHVSVHLSLLDHAFISLGHKPRRVDCCIIMVTLFFNFLEKFSYCFSQQFYFIFSATLVIFSFNNSYPNGSEMVCPSGFDLHFPNDWWSWASFHDLIGHPCIFFWRNVYSSPVLIFELGCFIICYWVLEVLSILILYQMKSANIFFHSVVCLFTPLTVNWHSIYSIYSIFWYTNI